MEGHSVTDASGSYRLSFGQSLVAPPAEFVGPALGRRGDVSPAVAVEVGDDHLVGARPGRFQEVHLPLPLRIAGVLEPDDAPLRRPAPSRGHHVEFAVTV